MRRNAKCQFPSMMKRLEANGGVTYADGQAHKSKEVKDIIAGVFDISAKEREEMLPSGKQPLFDNRIGWTRTYLKKAGLIQSPSRGVYIITPIGLQVLAENPQKIKAFDTFIFLILHLR